MKKIVFLLLCFTLAFTAHAQQFQLDTLVEEKNMFEKKTLWGFTFTQNFTSINFGEQPEAYFFKPSLGFTFQFQHFFSKRWGFSVGLGFQMRGTGIKYEFDRSNGNMPDSTNRFRYRFNCIELPLNLVYRSGKALFKKDWIKFSAFLGITPSYNPRSMRVYLSIEDGNHTLINMTEDFYRFDLLGNAGIGFDFNAFNQTLLQVHFIGNVGMANVYKNQAMFNNLSGHNTSFGIRLGFLF